MESASVPNIHEWIKKMSYKYTMEYYSARKKNEIVICRKMDGTGDHFLE
jgi:hypothetical protein